MIKRLLLLLSLVAVFSFAPIGLAQAANPLDKACEGLSAAEKKQSAACSVDGKENPLFGKDGLLNKITRGIALVAGAIAVIFMIIGGYKMILSGGDKQAFTNGRNTLIYAAVGLIVITLAQALISFIITRIN